MLHYKVFYDVDYGVLIPPVTVMIMSGKYIYFQGSSMIDNFHQCLILERVVTGS